MTAPLPIDDLLPQLRQTLQTHIRAVLQAAPGAGKTTRVPLALLDAPWLQGRKIVMLEPRRIAARAAARYMAGSLGEQAGATVGYRVRQDSKISARTRIEVVTEGVLTRMLQQDPELRDYGLVIFDEFHERNLNSDLGLALCLDSQQGLREDLRLLVMSATLDGAAVAHLLDDAPVLTSAGRSYPVTVHYRPLAAQYNKDRRGFLQTAARAIGEILRQESGSALVFLPGAGEIRQVHSALQAMALGADCLLAPLYGQQTPEEQDRAIQPAPAGKRKVVLATSIAETSLTIDGIRLVIDAGLMRLPRFDPNAGMSRLLTQAVSQAGAEQRCGRAGRLQAGSCYRLWPQQTYLLPFAPPEIADADLAPLLLELAAWGVSDPQSLRWLDPPPPPHVDQAADLLRQLGALDDKRNITAHGRTMAQWGTHPRLAHMMLRGKELGAGALACALAAILNEGDPFRGTAARDADLRWRVLALRERQAAAESTRAALFSIRDTARQWQRQLGCAEDWHEDELRLLGVLLACAYPDRVGKRRDGDGARYLLSNGRGAWLAEDDPLAREPYLVAAELDGDKEARIYLAAAIDHDQLLREQAVPLQEHEFVDWDERNDCVRARRQQRLGAVVIDDAVWTAADGDAITAALLTGIRRKGLGCLPWDDASRDLQARLQFLHQQVDSAFPASDDAALLTTLEDWLAPYLSGMSRLSHLQKLDLRAALLARLPWERQKLLDDLAPSHLTVPSGSRIAVDYGSFPPVLAVRLQEMFGQADTPTVAGGRVAVVLHLLSPARRPVQITQDLAGFWRSSYQEVKKEMKGRYPKHHWPDDPLQAEASRGTQKRPHPP